MIEYEARIAEIHKSLDEMHKHAQRLYEIAIEQNEILKKTPRMLKKQFVLGMIGGIALSVAFTNILVLALKLSGVA